MDGKESVVDTIIDFVNNNFKKGNNSVQVNNFKLLVNFIESNYIPTDLDFNDYLLLLDNSKITDMIKSLTKRKDCDTYLEYPLFYSLALVYSNNHKIDSVVFDKKNEEFLLSNEYDESDDFVETDAFKAYMREIPANHYTKEEEREMFIKFHEGDLSARDEIYKHNLKLVVRMAMYYFSIMPKGVELLDLIQEGNIGLGLAIDRFNYKTGLKFSTYATWWIRLTITRGVSNYYKTIRIPIYLYEYAYKIKKFRQSFMSENNGKYPSIEEIAKGTGLSIGSVERVNRLFSIVSLDEPIYDDKNDLELKDIIEDERIKDPSEKIFLEQFRNHVFNSGILSEKEKLVIMYRFGFVNGKIYGVKELEKMFNVTRQRICQIVQEAIEKLRNNCAIKQFDPTNDGNDNYKIYQKYFYKGPNKR